MEINPALLDNVSVMIPYLTILRDSAAYLSEAESCTLEGDASAEYLVSCRNRGLAHSPESKECAFIGNLSILPTVTVAELEARGIKTAEAEMLIASRDTIRTALMGLV